MRSKVDLPEPLRPTRQIRSPVATTRPAPDSSGATPKVRAMSCSRSNGGSSQPLALCLAPNRREPGLPLSRQTGRTVVMVQLDETGRNHVAAPSVQVEKQAYRPSLQPSLLFPRGFDENRTPRGFNVSYSSSSTL